MNSITLKYNQSELIKLEPYIQSLSEDTLTPPPYALYCYLIDGCRVTAYNSGKLLLQGNNVDELSKYFQISTPSPTSNLYPQAGSDEVGTGDYFGPVVVCACIVQAHDIEFLTKLGVNDSKMITDDVILKIAPELIQRLPYSLLVLDNTKYNQIHPQNNMVAIKAKLHNQAYVHLRRKANGLPSLCIVDQFAVKNTYYKYLQDQNEIVEGLHFETKAEHKYLAVAASSVIARYAFLKKMEEMNQQYDMIFEKGASHIVDQCGVKFVKKYGSDKLNDVAKVHFANTQKILSKI